MEKPLLAGEGFSLLASSCKLQASVRSTAFLLDWGLETGPLHDLMLLLEPFFCCPGHHLAHRHVGRPIHDTSSDWGKEICIQYLTWLPSLATQCGEAVLHPSTCFHLHAWLWGCCPSLIGKLINRQPLKQWLIISPLYHLEWVNHASQEPT